MATSDASLKLNRQALTKLRAQALSLPNLHVSSRSVLREFIRERYTLIFRGADCDFLFAADDLGRAAEAEGKKPDELTEEDKMALLGKPKLGDVTRAQIRIKESKEFKVRFKIGSNDRKYL